MRAIQRIYIVLNIKLNYIYLNLFYNITQDSFKMYDWMKEYFPVTRTLLATYLFFHIYFIILI